MHYLPYPNVYLIRLRVYPVTFQRTFDRGTTVPVKVIDKHMTQFVGMIFSIKSTLNIVCQTVAQMRASIAFMRVVFFHTNRSLLMRCNNYTPLTQIMYTRLFKYVSLFLSRYTLQASHLPLRLDAIHRHKSS